MEKTAAVMKRRIADCFINLVIESSNPRVRVNVTTLVKKLEIDRKTFYNHFDNTTDLVVWIFRSDLAEVLKGRDFYAAELDYPAEELRDKYVDLPCYARFRNSEDYLNQRPFFYRQCTMLNKRDAYYRHIFSYSCYIDFYRYVESLTIPLLRKDILIMLGPDRELPEDVLDFLAEYHTIGLWGRVQYYYSYKNRPVPEKDLEPFWNYAHKMIRLTIDALFEDSQLDNFKGVPPLLRFANPSKRKYLNKFS